MKRFSYLILAASLLIGFSGCGSGGEPTIVKPTEDFLAQEKAEIEAREAAKKAGTLEGVESE